MYFFLTKLVGATIDSKAMFVLIGLPFGMLTLPLWLIFETIRIDNELKTFKETYPSLQEFF